VKEHLLTTTALSASDRAALQSLIPLASGLGAGTIFGLFFVGRRRASFAVFESIAIVAVLVSVATTAYYSIALLHRDTAITNQELVETAVPLLVAAVLLILISIVARLRGATQRISVLLPLVLVAVVAAIELASSGIAIEPGAAPVVALVILAAGAGFGALGTAVDGRARRRLRHREHERLARLSGRGYALAAAPFAVALPRLPDDAGAPTIDVWRRGASSFLDGPGALRLRDEVDRRWQSLAAGEARAPIGPAASLEAEPSAPIAPTAPLEAEPSSPIGPAVLLEAEPSGGPRRGDAPNELRLAVLRPGADRPRREANLVANHDGLFDVSELVAG
jgi:hypothetical protein